MSKFDPAVTLPQTIDFITEAQTLVVGISLEQLLADPIKLRVFERVMELVGESVKRVPQDFRDTHSQIPWKKIAGMRDVIRPVAASMPVCTEGQKFRLHPAGNRLLASQPLGANRLSHLGSL